MSRINQGGVAKRRKDSGGGAEELEGVHDVEQYDLHSWFSLIHSSPENTHIMYNIGPIVVLS